MRNEDKCGRSSRMSIMEPEAKDDHGSCEKEIVCTRCASRGCKQCCCSWNIYWKAVVWLCVVIVYMIMGAIVFMLAEGENEKKKIELARAEEKEARWEFNRTTRAFVESIVNLSNLSYDEVANMTAGVVAVTSRLTEAERLMPTNRNPIWEFGPAIFFATTVMTTIGYGSIAPVTSAGQTLFIFYALIGIPITLIYLGTLGEILSKLMDRIPAPVGRKFKVGKKTITSVSVQTVAVILAMLAGMILFIFLPALVYNAVEPWSYGEAVYFCFVTLTTVGFGDIVPAKDTGRLETYVLVIYEICSAIWIWMGLAFVALVISRIQKLIEAIGQWILSCCRHRYKSWTLRFQTPLLDKGVGKGNKQGWRKKSAENEIITGL